MKLLYFPRYSSEVPKTDVGSLVGANLAFVNPPQLDPTSATGNISIVDRSFSFPENNTLFANTVRTFTGNAGTNDTNNILITNQYSNTQDYATLDPVDKTIPVRPLWYQHSFPITAPIVISPNGSFNVLVFDSEGVQITPDHYALFPSTGTPQVIYTDLINTIDKWYYVIYQSTSGQVRKLLSVLPIFKVVNSFTGSGTNQYITSYNSIIGQWQISVLGDPTITYSMLTIGTTKINVEHPIQAQNTQPWYVELTNGYFKRRLQGPSFNNTYEYFMPEYSAQAWNPIQPFMYQADEKPIFLDNNLLRLRQNPLTPPGVITNDVEIYIRRSSERSDATNEAINAQGGIFDIVPFGSNTVSTIWWRVIIDDIDRNTGLVSVAGIVSPTGTTITTGADALVYNSDDLHAFYNYEQLEYVFTSINLNPIFDRSLLTKGISIYIKPAVATVNNVSYSTLLTVAFLVFDDQENIVFSSDPTIPLGATIDGFYTQTDGSGIPLVGRDHTTFLELARVFVRNVATIKDLVNNDLVDTRIEGGKLISNISQQVIDQINTDTNGLYNLLDWQGAVLPGNSVVVIKVPSYLLNDNFEDTGIPLSGSELTQRMIDVRTMCKKHLALGVLPIVRFYDNNTGTLLPIKPPLDRTLF